VADDEVETRPMRCEACSSLALPAPSPRQKCDGALRVAGVEPVETAVQRQIRPGVREQWGWQSGFKDGTDTSLDDSGRLRDIRPRQPCPSDSKQPTKRLATVSIAIVFCNSELMRNAWSSSSDPTAAPRLGRGRITMAITAALTHVTLPTLAQRPCWRAIVPTA